MRVFAGILRVKLVVGVHQTLSPKPQNNIKRFPLHVGLQIQRSQPGHEQADVLINSSFVVVTSMYLLHIESSLPLTKDELIATLKQAFSFLCTYPASHLTIPPEFEVVHDIMKKASEDTWQLGINPVIVIKKAAKKLEGRPLPFSTAPNGMADGWTG